MDAVHRWYVHDWNTLDNKIRSSIVEGVSVFLSMFDLPSVARVFCPPAPEARQRRRPADQEPTDTHGTDNTPLAAIALSGDLPPLDQLIERGKVLALNMPAGTNPALARAVGVMLKNAWLQSLLRRPATMKATPGRYVRPAVFICDEYQAFASVGEDDPSGDEKAFALTRQCRVIPIVATQSISSLRSVLGSSEAWRTLLQTLRTRIFGNGLDLLKPFLPGLEAALDDPDVSEIMINGPGNVWLEGHGRLRPIAAPALDAAALERAAIHIARPLGLDPATTPVLDARLGDGSRVAICVPPASPHVAITVRRFGTRSFSAAQLVEQGALPEHIRAAAERTLHTRRNILVSGGTGSGKTTLLNALIARIPDDERIVAIEDTLELRIDAPNCVRFEARGLQQGAVTIRDLVRHALRHRPDHIVVGEVRGGEAADLLQALNTGHGGSLTTVHANNAESALSRLASCAMQGGGDLPWDVTCRGVVDGISMVIHMTRADGRRVVEEAAYVRGYDPRINAWDIERLDRKPL